MLWCRRDGPIFYEKPVIEILKLSLTAKLDIGSDTISIAKIALNKLTNSTTGMYSYHHNHRSCIVYKKYKDFYANIFFLVQLDSGILSFAVFFL